MPPFAELQLLADAASDNRISRPSAKIVPLRAAAPAKSTLLDWALAAAATAEKRVADLQARLLHLESLSVTDELTGAVNRRGLIADLGKALSNARRSGIGGVLAMVDLDGFKGVNDSFGHNAGDEILRQVTALMMRKVRGTDTVARLGGDEFALVLPATTLATARRKATCLVKAIEALTLPVADGRPMLGASIGLTTFDGSEALQDLLAQADAAMYSDKHNRRALRAAAG